MQALLISYILNPLGRKLAPISQKNKDRIFILSGLTIIILSFLRHSELVDYRYLYHFVACCGCVGLMILSSLEENLKPVPFRKSFAILWFSYGILKLISGIRHSENYLPEAALILVAYPILFLVWRNTDYTRIFHLLCRILRLSLWIFAIASWMFSPISVSKYPGIFTNTNNASYYLSLAVVALLLMLMYGESRGKEFVKNVVALGIAVGLNYYTNSRTGPFGVIFALVLGLGVYLLRHDRAENIACLKRLGIGAAACVVSVTSLVYVYQLRHYVPMVYFDGDEKGVYEATREDLMGEYSDIIFDISGFVNISHIKNETDGKDLNAYSTGRITIWKAYASELNWSGHEGVPPKYFNKEIKSTHMTPLQIAYESGIPTGVAYLLMNIASGMLALWFAWKHGKLRYATAPVMFTAVFGVLSMLGSCPDSFGYLTTLFYYLAQFPILLRHPEETK